MSLSSCFADVDEWWALKVSCTVKSERQHLCRDIYQFITHMFPKKCLSSPEQLYCIDSGEKTKSLVIIKVHWNNELTTHWTKYFAKVAWKSFLLDLKFYVLWFYEGSDLQNVEVESQTNFLENHFQALRISLLRPVLGGWISPKNRSTFEFQIIQTESITSRISYISTDFISALISCNPQRSRK